MRLELRLLARGELKGSIYSARPIEVADPIWRVDLLETASGPRGSLDRAHHHPTFTGWEPGRRVFDEELKADPVAWVGAQLADLPALLARADVPMDDKLAADADSLRERAPEIMSAVRGLLDGVKAGTLAVAPAGDQPDSARISWL